ncbi:MAG: ABC transporter permease, partial [Longimicrobiales bacterium]
MLETFRERQREARPAGRLALVRVWASEFADLLVVLVRARRRDGWQARLDRERVPKGHVSGGRGWVREVSLVDKLKQDLRFAVRSCARRPGVNLLAAATIALGVGASSAMFSVVDAVLLRPLPYRDPGRIMTVYPTIPEWREHPSLRDSWERGAFSYPEFVEWSSAQRSFDQAAAVGRWVATILDGDGDPERVQIGLTTAGLFPMLGVEAAVGRTFTADDDADTPAVLLSHGLWQRRFGGDESVVGRAVRLDDVAHTIVGVLPREFVFPARESDVWQLISRPYDEHNRDSHRFSVIARLAAGATRVQAQAEADGLLRSMSPPDHIQHGARVWPHLDEVTRHVRGPLWLLVGASWLLLLIACVNVGTLLLGAGIDRETELSVRAAIGAGRHRIAAQLLTESLTLAAVGGAAGVLLARAATRLLTLLAPAGIPRIEQVTLDSRILAFAVAISALSGLLFGLVPALALSRTAPGRALYTARAGGQKQRLHSGLVVVEMALATLLLAVAGLMTRNMAALNAVHPGFDPENLLTVQVAVPYERFASGEEDAAEVERAISRWSDEILAELRSIPGVEAVAVTSSVPHSGDRANSYVEPEGYVPAEGEVVLAERRHVSWNYLDVMRMRLREGRTLIEADDRADADPVAVVSEDLARYFWRGESAVGKHLGVSDWRFRIVGVVAETRELDLAGDPDGKYYAPVRVTGSGFGGIVIRTRVA